MPYSEVDPASLPTTIYQYTSCKTLSGLPARLARIAHWRPTINPAHPHPL